MEGYSSSLTEGVSGYGGRLDIRPKYQRNFVYKDHQRDAVIDTVRKGFPLNIMYWAVNIDDKGEETYEVIDGQQRTISIAQYVTKEFSIDYKYFHTLTEEEREQILEYKLDVYFCTGTEAEKLDWFKVVNIAGEKLSDQELRNAVYTGPWLSDAKAYLSKTNGAGYNLGKDYLSGDFNRQAYLETAIDWISDGNIKDYMSKHQHDKNADELWNHFQNVIGWVKKTFPVYRKKEMRSVDWGRLYTKYGKTKLNPEKLEEQISSLMLDEDVTSKSGIYVYVLEGDEHVLSIRKFSDQMKREAFERQKGKCVKCKKGFDIGEMEGDHITPWKKGGPTISDNCQMLCRDCNRRKTDK